jgi:hypothetical protein
VGEIESETYWKTSSFAVSLDGQWILLTKRDHDERDLILVENFR